MKVLGICASPRRGGNTYIILENALKDFALKNAETEFVFLPDLKINPCRECGGCDNTGICVVDDDMQRMYPKLESFDIVIVASPIFFGNVTSNMKALMDRCQCLWIKKYVLKKTEQHKKNRQGGFISVCGGKQDFFSCAAKSIKTFFVTMNTNYQCELFFFNVDKKADILHEEDVYCRIKKFTNEFITEKI